MANNEPCSVWIITPDEFDSFVLSTGARVVSIAENNRFRGHPAILTAGPLLPPIDAIEKELDGNLVESANIYTEYLTTEEPDRYISVILALALLDYPLGIMFGDDEMQFSFPAVFVDFLYNTYGLSLGCMNKYPPFVSEQMVPILLAKLYSMGLITYEVFMRRHPSDLPIFPGIISKLAYDQRPLVDVRDAEHYAKYFEDVKASLKKDGKFLIDPLVSIDSGVITR